MEYVRNVMYAYVSGLGLWSEFFFWGGRTVLMFLYFELGHLALWTYIILRENCQFIQER